MAKYRKKPVVIDAFQWTGDIDQKEDPEWAVQAIKRGVIRFDKLGTSDVTMIVSTLEGPLRAKRGDYIIRGVKGECYPCKPDIFEQTYEVIE
ncbi:hypothetical protein [Paenibacillus peoriae]|uniref:hypothetical protein n=1 Tax=Paenibacillus peoriae TaxID=59893 RepID=UPI00096E55D3|nr:hypothetical protein [Paenibacillus peoriae]OMF48602.1 hypothetical protein BK135_09915 [Paenibacillus peoriae]